MIRKLLLLVLLATPLAAQDAQDARLFIERIEVRNHKRVSPDVVVSESRLRAGREYSEADLRDASARLSRLPFLLSVEFALEKGSERGKHVLVLTVHETRSLFFLVDLQQFYDRQDGPLVPEYESRTGQSGDILALGYRWFVGRHGAIHVAFNSGSTDREFSRDYAAFEAGYTQYDLFGSRAFATLNLKRPIEGYGDPKVTPQVVFGVPLSLNQTLTVEYEESRFETNAQAAEGTFVERLLTARWTHNTTNELVFPTRGTLLFAGPVVGETENRYSALGYPVDGFSRTRFYGVEGGATHYFELSGQDSLWGDVRGDIVRGETRQAEGIVALDRTARYFSAGIGYAHSFWTPDERASGDSRIEVTARYSTRTRRPADANHPEYVPPGRDVRQAGLAWVRRTSWGTLRLGGGYAW